MLKKHNFVWKFYFLIFCLICFLKLVELFSPQATLYTFYHILIAFDPSNSVSYIFSILAALITCLCAVPVYCFAFEKYTFNKTFFHWLFFLRIIMDIAGHQYEWLFVQSFFRESWWLGLSCLGVIVLPILPSYIAHYLCMRREKTLF